MANARAKAGSRGKKIRNPARAKGVGKREVSSMINTELFQFTFNADYSQVMLRISNAPNGLRYGGAPPVAG